MRQNTTFTHKLGGYLKVTGNKPDDKFVMQSKCEMLDIDHKIEDRDH